MRKSSKAVSLLLSGLMATSCFTMAAVSASAAPAGSDETGAPMTADERIAAGHQLVFFQFPDTIWGSNNNVKYSAKKHTTNVFCNYYAFYGNKNEVKSRSWEAGSTAMMKDTKESSLYYFDITESGQGEVEEGAQYGILFSTKANSGQADLKQPNTDGYQTCDLYFDSTCLGDTFYVDPSAATRENTANSQKIDYLAYSKNGVSKPLKKISTLCVYIDGMDPGDAPKSVELANALQTYLPNPVNEPSFTWGKIEPTLAKFGTTAQEVYDMYVEKFSGKLAEGVPYEPVGDGSDLKDDGTLKDVYRYVSVTTTEEDPDTGVMQEKVTKYPTLDLVRERLNLPEQEETTAPEETTQPEETTEPEETTQPEETTEPVSVDDTFVAAGTPADIFGTAWDATNEANTLTLVADGEYAGCYTKEYTVDKAFDAVQLKAVKNGAEWIGDETGNNLFIGLSGAGTFTVCYNPDPAYNDGQGYVTAFGDIVYVPTFVYDTVFAVGNGEGTWLNGAAWDPAFAANEMNEVAEDVWEIEFADVPDGFERQLKFAIDGAWTHNFGGTFVASGEVSDAVYNASDNITFDTEDDTQTVKVQLDLREFDFATKEGAKFTVTIEAPQAEPVGIIGDVNGDDAVTVDDATIIQQRGLEMIALDANAELLADVNQDGRISILDVTCVQKYIAEYQEGTGNAGDMLLEDGTIVPANALV